MVKFRSSDIEMAVYDRLDYFGVSRSNCAHEYIKLICMMLVENPDLEQEPFSDLCDAVAEDYETFSDDVKKLTRKAIVSTWNTMLYDVRREQFPNYLDCPTTMAFLSQMARLAYTDLQEAKYGQS